MAKKKTKKKMKLKKEKKRKGRVRDSTSLGAPGARMLKSSGAATGRAPAQRGKNSNTKK